MSCACGTCPFVSALSQADLEAKVHSAVQRNWAHAYRSWASVQALRAACHRADSAAARAVELVDGQSSWIRELCSQARRLIVCMTYEDDNDASATRPASGDCYESCIGILTPRVCCVCVQISAAEDDRAVADAAGDYRTALSHRARRDDLQRKVRRVSDFRTRARSIDGKHR